MPMTCVAYGCNNHFVRGCGKQFFRFPMKDPERLSKWVAAIRRKNWKPSASSRICSDHFTDNDYMLRPGAMVPRLRLDAVPSVFNGFPKHLKERLERKKKKKTEEQVVVIYNQVQTQCTDQTHLDKEDLLKTNSSCENSKSIADTHESSLPAEIMNMDTAGNPVKPPTVVTHSKETMKMKTCVVYGCSNSLFKGCKKQFFRFPLNDPERLSKWIVAVQRKYWKPSTSSRICSDHFTDKDYMLSPEAVCPQLRQDAVPSIFSKNPKWKNISNDEAEDQNKEKVNLDPVKKRLPPKCVVYGCNKKFVKGCQRQFFRFPVKNPELLCQWIQAVRSVPWKPSSSSRICSDHFKDKDFILHPDLKVPRLHANAVPFVWKEKRCKKNNINATCPSSEQLSETLRPDDHTYSSVHNAVDPPYYKPDTIQLKKKVRTLQRQIQRQRHTIKKLSERIVQLRNNKDCSHSSLVTC